MDTEEIQTETQVPILPFVGVVDLCHTTSDAVCVLLHTAAGDNLQRPVQVLAEICEVLGRTVVLPWTMAMQKLPDLSWHQHGIRIHFESPRVLVEATIPEYLIPGLDEDATVQGGVILPSARREQIGINDSGLDPPCQLSKDLLGRSVANDKVPITTEDTNALLNLLG